VLWIEEVDLEVVVVPNVVTEERHTLDQTDVRNECRIPWVVRVSPIRERERMIDAMPQRTGVALDLLFP